jgi:hypothetical protein
VPKILNQDDVDIDKVVYHGDLKKKEDMVAFTKEFDAMKDKV